MSVTTITLPNGVTIETTAAVSDLAALLSAAPAAPAATTLPSAPVVEAETPKRTTTKRSSTKSTTKAAAKPSQPKAESDGKAVLAQIRALEAQGTVEALRKATELADDKGWVTVAAKLADKETAAKLKAEAEAAKVPAKRTTKRTTKKAAAPKEEAKPVGTPTEVVSTAAEVAAEVPTKSTVTYGDRAVSTDKLGARLEGEILQAIEDRRLHEVVTSFEVKVQSLREAAHAAEGVRKANIAASLRVYLDALIMAQELLQAA